MEHGMSGVLEVWEASGMSRQALGPSSGHWSGELSLYFSQSGSVIPYPYWSSQYCPSETIHLLPFSIIALPPTQSLVRAPLFHVAVNFYKNLGTF